MTLEQTPEHAAGRALSPSQLQPEMGSDDLSYTASVQARDRETRGRRPIDYSGRRFGRLVALERVGTCVRQNSALWSCRCDCGRVVSVSAAHLVKTPERDCGCSAKTIATTVPNAASRPEYPCWSAMWTRCTWPGHKNWALYGGRGIVVCDRWRDFALFLEDMGPRPSRGHSLDRIDNDRGYEPGNVRWATRSVQGANVRRAVFVDLDGQPFRISDAARRLGISQQAATSRLRRGSLKKFKVACDTGPAVDASYAAVQARLVTDGGVQ